MGWAEDFQNNIDQWNNNVSTIQENVADFQDNINRLGLTPTPGDVANQSPIKNSYVISDKTKKIIIWGLVGLIVLVLFSKLFKGSKKSLLSGL